MQEDRFFFEALFESKMIWRFRPWLRGCILGRIRVLTNLIRQYINMYIHTYRRRFLWLHCSLVIFCLLEKTPAEHDLNQRYAFLVNNSYLCHAFYHYESRDINIISTSNAGSFLPFDKIEFSEGRRKLRTFSGREGTRIDIVTLYCFAKANYGIDVIRVNRYYGCSAVYKRMVDLLNIAPM